MFNLGRLIYKHTFPIRYIRKCLDNNYAASIKYIRHNTLCNTNNNLKINALSPKSKFNYNILLCSSFLTWLGLSKDDEEKESELIMTLKRSILCMQQGELVKAEQMLHIALRLAQDQNSYEGVTYTYDLMANLALERSQVEKAEKLFINVLQRLLIKGLPQEDMKVVHISLKLARICHLKKEYEKAEIGFQWCLETIKPLLNKSNDAVILHGVIQDWYAQYLLEIGKYKDCLKYLEEAHKIYSKTEGPSSEKSILLLNDIGTANWQSGNYDTANEYLSRAVSLGKKIENFEHLGVIYANLGLVRLKQGILPEAQKYCKEGWRLGRKQNNTDAVNQANYCFEQIRLFN